MKETPDGSVFLKFRNRQTLSMVLKVRVGVVDWEGTDCVVS